MSGRQSVYEHVVTANKYDGEWPAENLHEFIGWLTAHLLSVPEEFRHLVDIDMDAEYDSSNIDLTIKYMRPETDQEMNQRAANENAMRAQAVENQEHKERQILAALKAKYE